MSLHWILALTVTMLHCFTAHTNPVVVHTELKEYIENLKKYGCNENDSTFYSPTGSGECTVKALDCSAMELEKVKTECFEENSMYIDKVDDTREYIKYILKKKNIELQANPINCFCGQENVEKPYNEFLDNILKLTERLNSIPTTKRA